MAGDDENMSSSHVAPPRRRRTARARTLAAGASLCCLLLRNVGGAGAFSAPTASLAVRGNNVGATTRGCSKRGGFRAGPRVGMALTEEFVRMKVNGESEATADERGSDGEGGGDANRGADAMKNASRSARERYASRNPLWDEVGYRALSTVQSLARVVGSDATAASDGDGAAEYDEEDDDGEDIDGFNKGAVGIAGVFSGRGPPSSRRTRVIEWQRKHLSGVRRAVVRSTAEAETRASGRRSGRGSETKNGNGNGGRLTTLADALPSSSPKSKKTEPGRNSGKDQTLIAAALQTLERDMDMLDSVASSQPQLSPTEVGLLLGAVVASGMGPIAFPGTSVTEVLAPAAAAFTASITIGSEYIGRVAVADGKEIAANTIQCAAEAEAFLANAERVKAITPLCVGVGATAASLTLLTPTIIEALHIGNSVIMITELYLFCPLVSVLSAAVSNLALEETKGFATRAINVGVRRFSKSGMVGRTWLSSSEQVQKNSQSKTERWWSFVGSVLPAPILGSIIGGPSLSAKCIVVATLAAAQSAYYLAQAESVLARATDAVALKARSAAVCDTYANQGARNSAILPFTSALSAFCAAATAATVELPFLDTIATLYGTMGEVAIVSTFPILSSAFAAAAAVSKARCEVDAEAAAQAASTLALEYDGMNGGDDDPVLKPFHAVRELVRLAVTSSWRSFKRSVITPWRRAILSFRWSRWRRRRRASSNGDDPLEGGAEAVPVGG